MNAEGTSREAGKERKRHIFTRAEIEAHFKAAFERDLADDEKIHINEIARLKSVSPACWVVDYNRESHTNLHFHIFHSQVIIVASRDFSGNPELRFAETEILPEEMQIEKDEK